MRVGICDKQPIFAESLRYVLEHRGDDVVQTVSTMSDAVTNADGTTADVWVIDVATAAEADPTELAGLRALSTRSALVLLVDEHTPGTGIDSLLPGVRAVAERRQRIGELLTLLDRVHAGAPPPGRPRPKDSVRPSAPPRGHGQVAGLLSPREREVLCGLVRGEDTQELARSLDVSAATVRSHVQNVLIKLGARNRLAAVTTAIRMGLVDPGTALWQDDQDTRRRK
jgi:two-component system nitrate/nitrite response regulator NarL